MPKIYIPPKNSVHWTYSPSGDIVGSLWYSKNIDPRSSLRKLRLSDRIAKISGSDSDSDLMHPLDFVRSNSDQTDRWWALSRTTDNGTSAMFRTTDTDPTGSWDQDTSLNTPPLARDGMDIFLQLNSYDRLVVPTADDLAMQNPSNSRSVNIASSTFATPIVITTSTSHLMATGEQVTIAGHLINTAANGTWTIIVISPTTFSLTTSVGNGVGVNTGTMQSGNWNRKWWTNTLAQSALDSSYPIVVRRFNKILLVGNKNFVHVITPSADGTISSSINVAYKRLVYPTGYEVNTILITGSQVCIVLNQPAGSSAIATFWDGGSETYFDPISLLDRYALAGVVDEDGIPWIVNGKGQLLEYTGSSFVQKDAFPCFYSNKRWTDKGVAQTLPTVLHRNGMRIIDGQIHMLVKNTLATLSGQSNAYGVEEMPAGIWVYDPDIGLYCRYTLGQFNGSTNEEWGARALESVGALKETTIEKGRFLAGLTVYTDDFSTTRKVIMGATVPANSTQRGHFVTTKLQVGSASAFWREMVAKFERLLNSTDAIVVKARTDTSPTLSFKDLSITWTSTTQFTSADADLANVVGGEEIEIVCGKGAGATAHVSVISFLAGTYTVTLDEAIPNVSGGARAVINNFQKLGSITDQAAYEQLLQIYRDAPWVQLKVELRGTITSPEFYGIDVDYEQTDI